MNKIFGTSVFQCIPKGNFVEFEVTERNEECLIKLILDPEDDHKSGCFIECD